MMQNENNNISDRARADELRSMSSETFAQVGLPNLVYVREILAGDLTADERAGEPALSADTRLYAVHAANGDRMAIVSDRATAFAGARQYDLEPQSVH